MNTQKVQFIKSAASKKDFIHDGRKAVVFAGRSNVGKSSTINCLLQRKNFARVGNTPGKTVQVNYFLVDETAYFVDLPGYGYAKVPVSEKERWAKLMEGYFATDRDIALVFSLVDMRHPPTADDVQMINFLIENEFPFVVVCTKCDKLSKRQQEERLAALTTELPCGDEITIIPFSAKTGEGVDQIKAIIEEMNEE